MSDYEHRWGRLPVDTDKTPSSSETIMTRIVYPDDTNPMQMLNGGRIIEWMDTACAICAQMHSDKICVTVAIDKVVFKKPAKLGDIVSIRAKITRAFTSSVEIFAEARSRRTTTRESFVITTAYFTFVALDAGGIERAQIPQIRAQSDEERREFDEAQRRREGRSR